MVLSWFDARAAKKFGSEMAGFYTVQVPLQSGLTEKQFAIKSKQVLSKMGLQVSEFKQRNKLNTYKIAQAGNTFKWLLKDAGYAEDYINKLTEWFISRLSDGSH